MLVKSLHKRCRVLHAYSIYSQAVVGFTQQSTRYSTHVAFHYEYYILLRGGVNSAPNLVSGIHSAAVCIVCRTDRCSLQ